MRTAFQPSELTFAGPIGRRDSPRLHLTVPAKLVSVCETQNCVLVDVSQTGARIRLERPLAAGASGYLRVGPIEVFATALRQNLTAEGVGLNGMEFDIRLTKAEVLALRAYAENYELAERRAFRAQARGWITGGR
jgi:hypothetical protein